MGHVHGEHPPERRSSGTPLSADHHLPLNRHPQGSPSPDAPPCQHPSLASLELSAFPRALVEPRLAPTWSPRKIPESGFPGARLPQIKLAENCLSLWADILVCHLGWCYAGGLWFLSTASAHAPAGGSALVWELDAPGRPGARRSPASPPGTGSSGPGQVVPTPPG